MLITQWKFYILGLTLPAIVIAGIVLTEYMKPSPDSAETIAFSGHSSYAARDITSYSQTVDVIIVGTITQVGDTYLREDRGLTSQQDIQVNITEVLKGNMKTSSNLSFLIEGGSSVLLESGEKSIVSSKEEKPYSLGENVLLFLGTNSHGDYVVYAGPYGKYLIDSQNNTTSLGDFTMPLSELKAKIREAL